MKGWKLHLFTVRLKKEHTSVLVRILAHFLKITLTVFSATGWNPVMCGVKTTARLSHLIVKSVLHYYYYEVIQSRYVH